MVNTPSMDNRALKFRNPSGFANRQEKGILSKYSAVKRNGGRDKNQRVQFERPVVISSLDDLPIGDFLVKVIADITL